VQKVVLSYRCFIMFTYKIHIQAIHIVCVTHTSALSVHKVLSDTNSPDCVFNTTNIMTSPGADVSTGIISCA
jgi:hypothetical protein